MERHPATTASSSSSSSAVAIQPQAQQLQQQGKPSDALMLGAEDAWKAQSQKEALRSKGISLIAVRK